MPFLSLPCPIGLYTSLSYCSVTFRPVSSILTASLSVLASAFSLSLPCPVGLNRSLSSCSVTFRPVSSILHTFLSLLAGASSLSACPHRALYEPVLLFCKVPSCLFLSCHLQSPAVITLFRLGVWEKSYLFPVLLVSTNTARCPKIHNTFFLTILKRVWYEIFDFRLFFEADVFATIVVDTSDKHKIVNISTNFRKSSKWPQRDTQRPEENRSRKKTWRRKSRVRVALLHLILL